MNSKIQGVTIPSNIATHEGIPAAVFILLKEVRDSGRCNMVFDREGIIDVAEEFSEELAGEYSEEELDVAMICLRNISRRDWFSLMSEEFSSWLSENDD